MHPETMAADLKEGPIKSYLPKTRARYLGEKMLIFLNPNLLTRKRAPILS
jgi:hypothetical protein